MELDTTAIQEAAQQKLSEPERYSFSSPKIFTKEEISAISEAITEAIKVYDEQRRQ